MDCYQDCNNTGNKTTTQGIPHLFDIDNVFDYVIFSIEPNATDLHIATYNNGTAYFVYTGEEWILNNYKDLQVFPDCMPPCEHFHTLGDVIGLSNYLDTLDNTLSLFLDTLSDIQDDIDIIVAPSYIPPNHTGDVTSVGDGPTTIGDGVVTAAKLAATGVTAGAYVNANINVNNKGQIISAVNGLQPIKSDWNAVSGLAEILNKPTIPSLYIHPNHTGDVTSTGDGATVIGANAVTTAKIADNAVTVAKLPAGATSTTFLKGNGTWVAPSLNYLETPLSTTESVGNASWSNICFMTLTPGTWLVNAQITALAGAETNFICELRHGVGGVLLTQTYGFIPVLAGSTTSFTNIGMTRIVTVGVNTDLNIAVKGEENGLFVTATNNATYLSAVKIV